MANKMYKYNMNSLEMYLVSYARRLFAFKQTKTFLAPFPKTDSDVVLHQLYFNIRKLKFPAT